MVERVTVTIEDQTTSDQIMSDQGFRVDMVDAGRKGRGARFERGLRGGGKGREEGWRMLNDRPKVGGCGGSAWPLSSLSLPFL